MSVEFLQIKDGVFRQMLLQFETMPGDRQAEFLKAVGTQNPGWAALLRAKALTLEKVFSWDASTLGKVLSGLSVRTQACFLALNHGPNCSIAEKAASALTEDQREQATLSLALTSPGPSDFETASILLFTHIRDLERRNQLALESIDPIVASPEARVA